MTRDLTTLRNVLAGLDERRGKLGTAWFSDDTPNADYRYLLLRGELEAKTPLVLFVMLNPSTADADADDPTIAKCRKYAARFARERGLLSVHDPEGAGVRVAVANLYAVRATDPRDAFTHSKPIGGNTNDDVIVETAKVADLVIAAWGANAKSARRAAEVQRLLSAAGVKLYRIGPPSKAGHPQHPLYLRGDLALQGTP